MYDKGVPLGSMKPLRECKTQYLSDPERYRGHLEPLYELLPDPLGVDFRMIRLMGIISGVVRDEQDGYVYHAHDLNGLFVAYDIAVEIASRLIMNLKEHGFTHALKQLDRLRNSDEFADVASVLYSKLELCASLYKR